MGRIEEKENHNNNNNDAIIRNDRSRSKSPNSTASPPLFEGFSATGTTDQQIGLSPITPNPTSAPTESRTKTPTLSPPKACSRKRQPCQCCSKKNGRRRN